MNTSDSSKMFSIESNYISTHANITSFNNITAFQDITSILGNLTGQGLYVKSCQYVFDTAGKIFIFKSNSGNIDGTPKVSNNTTIYGFIVGNNAILSSKYTICDTDSTHAWTLLLYVECDKKTFYCKRCSCEDTSGEAQNLLYSNIPGKAMLSSFPGWSDEICIKHNTNCYNMLYYIEPFKYGSLYYNTYIMRNNSMGIDTLCNSKKLCIKLIDVEMTLDNTASNNNTY